ncbi:YihY/virulence factor BrkB family protein [Ginsengibacter hankyongi]|uniref:YihY/virulence factor BrkB family protein n=1 Tax=Ginsengibacter hankyongi TaxID=2607284 RepID=A0A5J5IIE3_9BACT|nr:YihY/virulence factor BrkB family protein [Ginsengibacter hankyongi]KAA9038507.1 YihY/virulence factor BrkB family protein [Ginsengibacter hankyongi]
MIKIVRIFTEFHPVNFLIEKSKKWSPTGFQGMSLYEVLKYYGKNFSVPHLTERAAAISYNFIMAIPPTCLFIFTLIPSLPFVSKKSLKHQLHFLITDIIPAQANNKGIIQFVDGFIDGSKIGLISFTFILSLLFASNAVMGLMRSFNKDYVGFKKVKGLKKRWIAIQLTILLFGLLMVCFILLLVQSNILDLIGITNRHIRHVILYGRWAFIIALIFYSYAFIYKYAPSTKKRWKLVSPGAVIATTLSIIATIGFSAFVNNFGRYNILYGSIGSIMVVMIMIFLNSLVVLIGFEFNLSINTLKSISEQKAHYNKLKK